MAELNAWPIDAWKGAETCMNVAGGWAELGKRSIALAEQHPQSAAEHLVTARDWLEEARRTIAHGRSAHLSRRLRIGLVVLITGDAAND